MTATDRAPTARRSWVICERFEMRPTPRLSILPVLTLAFLAFLSGCTSSPPLVGRPGLDIVQQGELPAPTTVDLIIDERPYVIGPLDAVQIDIYGVPELSRTAQVDASGRIALPLIGAINVSGETTSSLATIVEDRLRGQYVRNPQVTVNLTSTVSQVVTVDGEVNTPGLYPVTGQMTLMRAIATAEGLADYAQPRHVVVFRRVANQELAALYDLRSIRQGIYADPRIYANDVVLVGTDNARRTFDQALSTAPLLAAPLITVLQTF